MKKENKQKKKKKKKRKKKNGPDGNRTHPVRFFFFLIHFGGHDCENVAQIVDKNLHNILTGHTDPLE